MLNLSELQEGELSLLTPNKEGNGNIVKLLKLPYFTEDKSRLVFEFVENIFGTDYLYKHNMFNPSSGKDDKQIKDGYVRFYQFAFAMIENDKVHEFNKENDGKLNDFVSLVELMLPLFQTYSFDVDYTIMVGYKTKYLSMPPYGDVISSKYKNRVIKFNPATKLTLEVKQLPKEDDLDGIFD